MNIIKGKKVENDVGDKKLSRNEEGAVKAFQAIMLEKLRANAHKGGWKNADPTALFDRVDDELQEARDKFDMWARFATTERRRYYAKAFAKEAGDVANFLMFVADVMGALDYPTDGEQG
jgi:hypothetical protein